VRVLYASFDEIPSHKGASVHVLSICRRVLERAAVHLYTLGSITLPSSGGADGPSFRHHPQLIDAPNYLERGLEFRRRVEHALRLHAPDLVHFRSPWEGLPAVRRGGPTVYEVNGLPSMELEQLYPGMTARVRETFVAWEAECLACATAIICPSARTRAFLLARHGVGLGAKLTVMPNGYDAVRLASGDAPPARAANAPLRLVYLGTLHPWQGVAFSLRALGRLARPATLEIYAPPHRSHTPHLERRIRRLGLADRVRLHAPLSKARLEEVLPGHDLALAPLMKTPRNTEQGCFPIKLLDYLAHGLPVLASDLFVTRQLLAHEGNALLHAPDDLDAIAAAIDRLDGDRALLRRLAAAAQPSLASLPTWDEHSRGVLALYARLVPEQISAGARGTPLAPPTPCSWPRLSVAR